MKFGITGISKRQFPFGLILYVGFLGLPLLAGLMYSLAYSFGLTGILSEGFTSSHWRDLLRDREAWLSLGYSLLLAVLTIFLTLIPALWLSWMAFCSPRIRFRKWLLLPMAFPPLIGAFAWYQILSPSGMLSRLAYALGWVGSLEGFPRLVNDSQGMGMMITHVFLIFPLFSFLFMYQADKEKIADLWSICQALGCHRKQFLARVFVPLLLKKSMMLIRLYLIFLIGTYEVAILLGKTSPRVVTLYITEKLSGFDLEAVPVGHAMLVLYIILVGMIAFGRIRKSLSMS